jgi:hypothetical protein
MAAEGKEKESSSSMVIALSALLALGAAGGVYYFYNEAAKAESMLNRAKDEYKKMAERKKPVEEFLRSRKGRSATASTSNEDMLVFLDKKSREAGIPAGTVPFTKHPPNQLTAWTETTYSAALQGGKDAGVKRIPIVDFLRKVETERRSTKVKTLQLVFAGDEFKSVAITFSEFTPKEGPTK